MTVLAFGVASPGAQRGPADVEWRHYSGDNGSTKYSPLAQITKDNVARLRIAWRRPQVDPASARTESEAAARPTTSARRRSWSTACCMRRTASASPRRSIRRPAGRSGCSRSPASELPVGQRQSRRRVLERGRRRRASSPSATSISTRSTPKTGKPVATFGTGGRVDLTAAIGRAHGLSLERHAARRPRRGGHGVGDGRSGLGRHDDGEPGDVRAYDVRTGKLRWTFHVRSRARASRRSKPGRTSRGDTPAPATCGR